MFPDYVRLTKKFFPDVKDVSNNEKECQDIVGSVFRNMLRIDQKFDTNQSFDENWYHEMVNESKEYNEWLESDSNWFVPLRIQKIREEERLNNAPVEKELIYDPDGNVITSKKKYGYKMYLEDIANHVSRNETIQKMCDVLRLHPDSAQVYYSNYKCGRFVVNND